jgi:hypothetical protein
MQKYTPLAKALRSQWPRTQVVIIPIIASRAGTQHTLTFANLTSREPNLLTKHSRLPTQTPQLAYTFTMSNGFTTCSAPIASNPSHLTNSYTTHLPHVSTHQTPQLKRNLIPSMGGVKPQRTLREDGQGDPRPKFCILSHRWHIQEGPYTTTGLWLYWS